MTRVYLAWTAGSAYARRRSKDENVLAGVAPQMVVAGVCLWIPALAAGNGPVSIQRADVNGLLYLLLVGSIVGFSAYAYALEHLPLATVSVYEYINPVIAVCLGRRAPRAVQRTNCRSMRRRARGHRDSQEQRKSDECQLSR